MPARRAVLTALAGLAGGLALAGCVARRSVRRSRETLRYGDDASQFGELTRPAGTARGVVVVIHGGFWRSQYDLSLGRPLAESLAARGFVAFNLEYRRVGNGGGAVPTLDDVAAGIDRLADVPGLDLSRLAVVGHSAGGHLAAWSASRGGDGGHSPVRAPVTLAVSQAGVVDLRAAERDDLGDGATQAFLGDVPLDARVDPAQQVPVDVPVWCVHGEDDTIVPPSQSRDYVAAARASGMTASLISVPGDHFAVTDVHGEAWRRTLEVLEEHARG